MGGAALSSSGHRQQVPTVSVRTDGGSRRVAGRRWTDSHWHDFGSGADGANRRWRIHRRRLRLGGAAACASLPETGNALRVPQKAQNLASSAICCPHSVQNIHTLPNLLFNYSANGRVVLHPCYEPDSEQFIALVVATAPPRQNSLCPGLLPASCSANQTHSHKCPDP